MPIYEYRCSACGCEMEKLQKLSDEPLRDCPACGEAALVKLISAAGFRLKGGGWYETDFKKDGKRNLASDGTDKSAAGDKSGDSKPSADSKPASTEKPASPKTTDKAA
ncbi:MAG: zinc ribbon domain-containing protein [Wenzhouxiangella sp.]|nr:zinc ribbon domain-containing protein [Wenzhouxiangella sp.]MCH8478642.1 zinc ribbon domain-containing protein [Wenzhouxiangella sp.]TVR96648.1 MAG: zinc ribbon domain-containing protein [Wenzhouxiangellaceae bacterium]